MIKALFFDLDGTLLNDRKQIPASALSALHKCREKGIKLFIATARAPMLAKMLNWDEDIMPLFEGCICCNGAVIKSAALTQYNYIESGYIRKLTEIVSGYPQVHFALNLTDDYHAFNHQLPDHMLGPWGLERDEIRPLDETAFSDTVKMIIYHNHLVDSDAPLPAGLYKEITDRFADELNIYLQDRGNTIQIAARDISKCSAINEVCAAYGYSKDQVAVFGDDLNDIEMLQSFPISIAMGNGEDTAKNAARYITLPNEQDGIAYAICEILKLI